MTETDKQIEGLMQEVKKLANQAEAFAYENYTLKKTIEELEKENELLKTQNKNLCESLDVLSNQEYELLAQIEKMKNCLNCKYNDELNSDMCIYGCLCENCNKWELAE